MAHLGDGPNGTRTRIRSAALDLLSKRGYEGTSMRDVAREVSLTTAALYYHFEGKEALLTEIVEPYLDDLDCLLADTPAGDDKRTLLGRYFDLLLAHAEVVKLLQRDLAVRRNATVARRYTKLHGRLSRCLGDGDTRSAARVAASLGALAGPVLEPGLDAGRQRDVIVDAAVRALGPPRAT